MHVDQAVLDSLQANYDKRVQDLADLVAIQSISTDGEHQAEIGKSRRADLRRRCARPG